MRTSAERGTRERILEVAEASLADDGYHGMRLHRIAERVGIQKASLFHYFPSKEHLYRAVLDEGLDETEQTLRQVIDAEGTPLEKIRLLVEAYVDMVAVHPGRTKILLRQSLGDVPSGDQQTLGAQRLLSAVAKFISEGQRAQIFAPIDPVALVLGVVGMVAFFFTSAPVLAPAWCGHEGDATSINKIKRHVVEVVRRCLEFGDHRVAAAKLATV
jgi:AcrR family transcriptional regulator